MSQGNRGTSAGKRMLTAEQKRRILQKRRMRRLKKRLMIIVPIVLVLVVALILVLTLGKGKSGASQDAQTAMSMEVAADSSLAADASASAEPVATPTPEPEVFDFDKAYVRAIKGEVTGPDIVYDYSGINPAYRERWTDAKAGAIPVLRQAKTNEKVICVTVDDCYQGGNFRQIVECAIANNAELTIFPIGDNITKPDVAAALKLAFENGMEIGNHTYNHVGLFHYDQERMINEIWYQQQEVNRALGINYKQNFFRPRGGDERDCQRLHAYLNQTGYQAVAMWTTSGSNDPMDKLINGLAPGNVYLFHTTDNDLQKLLQFIPEAVARGYRLITMSEMFGLQQPTVSLYQPEAAPAPLKEFKVLTHDMNVETYARSIASVQQRLIDLGWMSGESTGYYGKQTMIGVGFFQMAIGQEADGIADLELQKIIFSDDAPRGSLEKVQEFCRQLGKPVLSILPGTLADA